MGQFQVGDHVRIERDEVRYHSRGTWPTHRGQTGYVVTINVGGGPVIDGVQQDEFGVVLTTHRPPWRKEEGREHELAYDSDAVKWFRDYEMRHIRG